MTQEMSDLIDRETRDQSNSNYSFSIELVACKCCGKGVLEIKCPYCIHNEDITSIVGDKEGFCLSKDSEGNLH